MKPANRPAFSMIELIVVIAIMAVLAALLFSGVQQVRAAANRLMCASHARQLALACHNYHDTQGHFPPGMATHNPMQPLALLSWRGHLMPYLDQPAIWQQIKEDFTKSQLGYPPYGIHRAAGLLVPVLTCPADARTRTAWDFDQNTPMPYRVGLSSYLGNAGSDTTLPDGVMFANSRVRILDITDGSSSTLLFGERPPSAMLDLGWWYGSTGFDGRGRLDSSQAAKEWNERGRFDPLPWCPTGPFPYGSGSHRTSDPCQFFSFWSLHAGGANFGFADGSVRFLRYTLGDGLQALASRNGGEVVLAD